jgi:hypothetical protein
MAIPIVHLRNPLHLTGSHGSRMLNWDTKATTSIIAIVSRLDDPSAMNSESMKWNNNRSVQVNLYLQLETHGLSALDDASATGFDNGSDLGYYRDACQPSGSDRARGAGAKRVRQDLDN